MQSSNITVDVAKNNEINESSYGEMSIASLTAWLVQSLRPIICKVLKRSYRRYFLNFLSSLLTVSFFQVK